MAKINFLAEFLEKVFKLPNTISSVLRCLSTGEETRKTPRNDNEFTLILIWVRGGRGWGGE